MKCPHCNKDTESKVTTQETKDEIERRVLSMVEHFQSTFALPVILRVVTAQISSQCKKIGIRANDFVRELESQGKLTLLMDKSGCTHVVSRRATDRIKSQEEMLQFIDYLEQQRMIKLGKKVPDHEIMVFSPGIGLISVGGEPVRKEKEFTFPLDDDDGNQVTV